MFKTSHWSPSPPATKEQPLKLSVHVGTSERTRGCLFIYSHRNGGPRYSFTRNNVSCQITRQQAMAILARRRRLNGGAA